MQKPSCIGPEAVFRLLWPGSPMGCPAFWLLTDSYCMKVPAIISSM